MRKYYIFGLQRSGTNYIEDLLRTNFDANRLNRAERKLIHSTWKHLVEIPYENLREGVPIIMMYKNPYLWVESLCWRNAVDWRTTQLLYPATEGNPDMFAGPHELNVVNLAKTYLTWHRAWNTPSNRLSNATIIKYESLLDDNHVNVLNQLKRTHGFVLNRKEIVDIKKGAVGQSGDYTDARENYYASQKTQHLSAYHKNLITSTLGPGNIKKWGYDIQ